MKIIIKILKNKFSEKEKTVFTHNMHTRFCLAIKGFILEILKSWNYKNWLFFKVSDSVSFFKRKLEKSKN